jgi:penicillin-binding protein 1A
VARKRAAKKKKSGGGGSVLLKTVLVMLALVFLGFLVLLQAVRSGVFGALPDDKELLSIRHEQATLVLAHDGSTIGKVFAKDRTNVRYEDLPKQLVNALVSTEDSRFFTHEGVDGRSYLRVFFRTLLGGDRSGGGGSTISQQIMKNLYGRSRHGVLTVPVNKMKEALMAQRLERVLSKEDVLVLYFNSVPFGENVYGVEAAAQRYFSKRTKDLRVEEAAVLVGMLKANTTYNPRTRPENAKRRRDVVLQLMHENGHLTAAAADSLKSLPLRLTYSGGDAYDLYGYFVARVTEEARIILKEVAERTGVNHDIEKDGLRIHSTLDPVLQRSAQAAARTHLAAMQPKLDAELRNRKARNAWEKKMSTRGGARWKENSKLRREVYDHTGKRIDSLSYRDSLWHYQKMLHAAVLMMEPSSGAVRAWLGGNDHRTLPYDLVRARRPIASTIKPVIYAAAMERGFMPCDYLDNTRRTYAQYEGWSPDNFDRDTVEGEVAMWHALARSLNRPTVDLYFRTGQDTLRRTFEALGLPAKAVGHPAVALGAAEIALQEIVPAYGAFAMQGKRLRPVLITKIIDAQGKVIHQAKEQAFQQALTPEVAAGVNAMLIRAVDQGTGAALRSRFGVTEPIAGKTGTSQDHSDAWFVAYTPGLVIGTWVGAFDPEIHFSSSNGTGGQLALPIAGQVLKEIRSKPELRKRYIHEFAWMDAYPVDLECTPVRERNLLEQLIHDVFGPKRERRTHDSLQEKKDLNFFERLFKKKN